MSVSLELLALPAVEAIMMGCLSGVVGALALVGRKVFLTESLTHATFPGAVSLVVVVTSLSRVLGSGRPGYEVVWTAALIGAVIMCVPMAAMTGWLTRQAGLSSQSSAGAVLAIGFALGYLLNTWFAPLPLKIDSFLTGSLLNVSHTDVVLTVLVLAMTLLVVLAGGRPLIFWCFDPVGYRAGGASSKAVEAVMLALICLTIGALVPAVGTILPIALIAAPAASMLPWVRTPRALLLGSAVVGVLTCLGGLALAVVMGLSVGGVIAVLAGVVYALSHGASTLRGAVGARAVA